MARRIVLKLSGEIFGGSDGVGIDTTAVAHIAEEIIEAYTAHPLELLIVVGGGNVLRGASQAAHEMPRVEADAIGMLGTIINALAIASRLESQGHPAIALSATPMLPYAEQFTAARAIEALKQKKIVVCGGGTGNPYFSTDTTAVLRALEIGADTVYKATKVDGVYSADPLTSPDAVRYDRLTYQEAITQHLAVLDAAAWSLAQENHITTIVFQFLKPNNFKTVLDGHGISTRVTT